MRDGVTALAPGTSADVSQAELGKQVPVTRLLLLEAPPLTLSLPHCEDERHGEQSWAGLGPASITSRLPACLPASCSPGCPQERHEETFPADLVQFVTCRIMSKSDSGGLSH